MFFRIHTWCIEHKRGLVVVLFSILLATTIFALGYLLAKEHNQTPIIIEKRQGSG